MEAINSSTIDRFLYFSGKVCYKLRVPSPSLQQQITDIEYLILLFRSLYGWVSILYLSIFHFIHNSTFEFNLWAPTIAVHWDATVNKVWSFALRCLIVWWWGVEVTWSVNGQLSSSWLAWGTNRGSSIVRSTPPVSVPVEVREEVWAQWLTSVCGASSEYQVLFQALDK